MLEVEFGRNQGPSQRTDRQNAAQSPKNSRPLAKNLGRHEGIENLEIEPKCCGEEDGDHNGQDVRAPFYITKGLKELGVGLGLLFNMELGLINAVQSEHNAQIGRTVEEKGRSGPKPGNRKSRKTRSNQPASVEIGGIEADGVGNIAFAHDF